jgi:DNA polymerase-3 subunit chi
MDEDDEITPVLIVAPEYEAPMRPLVLNLRAGAVPGGFERVLEVVAADEAERTGSRERWREYQQRGFQLAKFDM